MRSSVLCSYASGYFLGMGKLIWTKYVIVWNSNISENNKKQFMAHKTTQQVCMK